METKEPKNKESSRDVIDCAMFLLAVFRYYVFVMSYVYLLMNTVAQFDSICQLL